MNRFKIFILTASLTCFFTMQGNGVVICENSKTTLNVGILDDNLPYSAIIGDTAAGFDPLLITLIAKRLGYGIVNFIVCASPSDALSNVLLGIIDVYANSGNAVTLFDPSASINGIVTDISKIYSTLSPNGYVVYIACCDLALKIEQAINEIVANGQYAQLLQAVRLADHTEGFILGMPTSSSVSGILLEPGPFFSSEFGSIGASGCAPSGPSYQEPVLASLSPISAYLLANFTPTITGPSGTIAVSA